VAYAGDFEFRVKISDFGVSNVLNLAKNGPQIHGAVAGTKRFMPPEALQPPFVVSRKTDVWSLGVLLWELSTKQIPFSGLSDQEVIERICNGQMPELPPGYPPLLCRLAKWCWSVVRPKF
jgi:serine/threonine protein kinase